ncbi:MAG: DUF362 domain-containing protein [Promethearchaeota archaeon]
MAILNSIKPEIAINQGESPKKCLLNGLDKIGGISKYINEGDQVFIKINLPLPNGYPTHVNFNTLEGIINSCNEVGADKIYVGTFPLKNVSVKEISDILGLKKLLKDMNAELSYLDNSNYYTRGDINSEDLHILKRRSMSNVEVNGKEFKIPKIILDSDKLISLNQVNVHPVFDFTLSLLNLYTMVPNSYRVIKNITLDQKEFTFQDQYKEDLITNILDIFMIKKPDLVINDLYHVLEGAGPYIFKDSNIKQLGALIVGNDAFYADLLALKVLNFDSSKNELLLKAKDRGLGSFELSNVIIHDDLKDYKAKINPCVLNLADINVKNVNVYQWQTCTGCNEQAYYLLNYMKTMMTKDLKYISKNSILIGKDPPSPENPEKHVILFGDCAINSTKNHNFRTITREGKKSLKKNKNILNLPGCPPNYLDCIKRMVKYYGKGNVPTLNLLIKTRDQKLMKKKEEWEGF